MFEIKAKDKMVERALLVGAYTDTSKKVEAESLLAELEELVDTLGIPVIERKIVFHREQHARYLIGSGKAQEIVDFAKEHECDVLVFDNELSPSQQRNWEELAGITVADRQEIILDIFGARAQTREARIQVDLARMAYSLPRLTRAWSHLGQQGGGIGAKGEGESQLEQDKRKIRLQIDRLKRELETVRKSRATQRKDRKRAPVPNAAIVGYTNVGKSSLLRRLTGAEVLIENKLFATLDTTTRKITLPNKQPLLLTDTVGFVRKLPHQLVEAFNATLEEAGLSDFLIHVLDASQPEVIEFYNTTMKVLTDLGADTKQMLVVFNKVDKVSNPFAFSALRRHFPDAVSVSAATGEGMEELVERISEFVGRGAMTVDLRLPSERADLLARLHREGSVRDLHYEDGFTRVEAALPTRSLEVFAPFLSVPDAPLVAAEK
ncbi:MAG TPA: GTPase HflX [Chthoniobacterales bacterium]|jgi:GTP-binding protein HflX|nr:GTPase HflX [Chthoniobacterales bacterium]